MCPRVVDLAQRFDLVVERFGKGGRLVGFSP